MIEHPSTETLQEYLDGELTSQQQRGLEAHVRDCSTCETELAHLRSLYRAIESIPSEQLSTDLAPSVMAAIQKHADWLPTIALGELLAAATLSLVVVLGLGGGELQARIRLASNRLIGELEPAALGISDAINGLLSQVPQSPQWEFIQLGGVISSLFGSPLLLWTVVAAAFALLLLGNGLVLRMGKDRNV